MGDTQYEWGRAADAAADEQEESVGQFTTNVPQVLFV